MYGTIKCFMHVYRTRENYWNCSTEKKSEEWMLTFKKKKAKHYKALRATNLRLNNWPQRCTVCPPCLFNDELLRSCADRSWIRVTGYFGWMCALWGSGWRVNWVWLEVILGFWGKATCLQRGDECAFEGQGGLALSSGKFRSAGSPLMTIVDISQVGQFERGCSGSQFSSNRSYWDSKITALWKYNKNVAMTYIKNTEFWLMTNYSIFTALTIVCIGMITLHSSVKQWPQTNGLDYREVAGCWESLLCKIGVW